MKPVWIIDDDRSIRWVLEKALGRESIACRSFSSADEALVALDAGAKPDVFKLRDVMRAPELGALIGKRFMDVAEGYYCAPDLDVTPLYRHGKLQTWSLKEA